MSIIIVWLEWRSVRAVTCAMFFLRRLRPPMSTRTDAPVPYTPRFRSHGVVAGVAVEVVVAATAVHDVVFAAAVEDVVVAIDAVDVARGVAPECVEIGRAHV